MYVCMCVFNLLRIDDLESLLHFAALVPPAFLIGDQRDVRMINAVITVTAVHALTVLIVTKIIITEQNTTFHCHGNRAVALKAVHTKDDNNKYIVLKSF